MIGAKPFLRKPLILFLPKCHAIQRDGNRTECRVRGMTSAVGNNLLFFWPDLAIVPLALHPLPRSMDVKQELMKQ